MLDYGNYFEIKDIYEEFRFKDILAKLKSFSRLPRPTTTTAPYLRHGILSFYARDQILNNATPKFVEALQIAGVLPADLSGLTDEDILNVFEQHYFNRSSGKYVSPYFAGVISRELIENESLDKTLSQLCDDPYTITADSKNAIAREIGDYFDRRFGDNLVKIATAYFDTEYNPLENYNMYQVETPDITRERHEEGNETETPNIVRTRESEGKDTETPDITRSSTSKQGTDIEMSGNREDDVYGFNSPSSVPATEGNNRTRTIGDKEGNVTEVEETEEGTREMARENSETETERGNRSHERSGDVSETESGTRELTRSGNIGVTTSQQMLQSELELRRYDFLEHLYKCLDEILVCSCY